MNTENKPNEGKIHRFCMSNRANAQIEGVLEVISFDDKEVLLDTSCGMMTIDGTELRISTLNTETGLVALEGRIDAITYFEKKNEQKSGGFFSRMLR